ncbi:MAG: glycosyltransferase [Prevotella sp.]|nr:glycosyltransferase [Prevotella sp.]
MNLEEKMSLSILIPTYNYVCVQLVSDLHQQAAMSGISFEIIVADDGSDDSATIAANRAIDNIPFCRYDVRSENVGRARIRNYLAEQAQYVRLLFIDSDMVVLTTDFLSRYIKCSESVVDGGVSIGGSAKALGGNLRFRYEKSAQPRYTARCRQQNPYRDLHTANLMVSRDVMLKHPFDSRFTTYGYEDVLFGKSLEQAGVDILHISNPLSFEVFEENSVFLAKSEEALATLYTFRDELRGYSAVLNLAESRVVAVLSPLLRLWHRVFGAAERRHLCGRRPLLTVFQLYKLGYYLQLSHKQQLKP